MAQKFQPYKRIAAEDLLSPNLEISPELSRRAYLNMMEDMQKDKQSMEDQRIAVFNILEDMQVDKEMIDKQQIALVNMLEDINKSQEQLKKSYAELDTLKDLVQELGSSLKTTVVLNKLVQALRQTLPPSTNLSYIIPSVDPGRPSNLIYIHAITPLSAIYLNALQENFKLSFDLLPTKIQRREEIAKWIHSKFFFEFIEGTKDGDTTSSPLSIFNVPLIVRDEMLGVINISSPQPNLFTEKDINITNTMVGATASTISRLRQLLDSEQSRVQSLVESLTNGVIMFDQDLRVTMSNPVAQQMTGLPSQGFYLSELTKLFTGAAAAAAAADKELFVSFGDKISQTLETGKVTHIEEAHISRFSYEVFVNPVRDYEKNIIGGAIILHDITHLKEIDKMKTEFVSVASHQLRTPLTAIKLFTEMIADEEVGKLNNLQKGYISDVRHSTERMIKLVNDLLNVSRLETGRLKIEPQLTQLEGFIQNIIDEADALSRARKCKTIFKKPKKKLPEIPIDRVLMRQVIHNLITNAIRYSPAEKNCSIVVTLGVTRENNAKFDAKITQKQKSEIIISVADFGIGIPEDAQSRIFEKFFRAGNAAQMETEGSGLGLYVCKMIVEASGGKIWFSSKGGSASGGESSGKGTTFYVTIPVKGMVEKKGERGFAT